MIRRAPRHRRQKGFTFPELLVATGIIGILAGAGVSVRSLRGVDLAVAQDELRGSLHQAFAMARAQGRNVTVAMQDDGRTDVLPVHLPKSIKWGKPASIPLPPGVDQPKKADVTGEAHAAITVTPRRTATAALWFLNDGDEALCMRLNGHGNILMYRYRRDLLRWVKV
jgi:prepilin-type N-terminal cleavage/methylation domain-containing protein